MEKTNIGLVEYAKAQLGNPYWFGTFGQIADAALHKSKKKQYPSYYTASDFPKQYGKRVHDCIGLIKGYLFSDTPTSKPKYNVAQDKSADAMYNLCKPKGNISTLPEVKGVLVFFKGHVGVYIGNGYVIEARGHKYGVVKTKLKSRPWKTWGYCPYITYITENESTESKVEAAYKPTVREWQLAAIADGFKFPEYSDDGLWGRECEDVAKKAIIKKRLIYKYKNLTKIVQKVVGVTPDGKCGKETAAAIKAYQAANGLEADGAVGLITWRKMLV